LGVTTHEDIATEVRGLAVQRCGVWRGFIGTRKEPIGVVTGTSYNIHTAHTAELYHPAVTHTQATCRRTATRRSAIAEKAPCTGNRIRVSVRPELRPRIRYGPKLPPLDSNPTSTLSLLSYPHLIIVNELVPFDEQGHGALWNFAPTKSSGS